ncbi:phosphopantetheine-binding protein [Actinokineospora guangxiensis]|uniref:Phosphopantetheine-binding protein n=1 Tax=Actinokineospora guangxiensis TaxID=1490288 RepID=A0ABW0ER37_9PSEU
MNDPADLARRAELEAVIADVWSEVLGRPVATTDDFFAIGGNSLHAVQIVSRTEEITGEPLSVRAVLEGRTVAAMAEAVARAVGG